MRVIAAVKRQHDRITPTELRGYPWWLSVGMITGTIGVAIGAMIQRVGVPHYGLVVLAGALAIGDVIATSLSGRMMPPWLVIALFVAAVALFAVQPVKAADMAPLLFSLSCAKLTVIDGVRWGLAACGTYLATLVVIALTSGLPGIVLFLVAVALGFDVGYTFRFQNRVLTAERARVDAELERAALDERRRIAREIHDLVAHSLSVTMLHVTGARHALSADGDIDDAMDALREAETVGRQAMAEIRRTVGVLRDPDPSLTTPLPGAQDIGELVATVRSAGLRVDYEQLGDATSVPPSLGLGLYRITQESLSNIAKHAPSAPAQVRLELAEDSAHLQVSNRLPAGAVAGSGAGLPGMQERARQLGGALTAGPAADEWRVELRVPASGAGHICLLARLRGEFGP